MTVSAQVEADISRLFYREHFPVGTICSQLGCHAEVVKRVLGLLPPSDYEPKPRALTLAPYVGFIQQTLEQYPRLCSTRLYDMLTERGYPGSVRTVRSYVQKVRPKKQAQAFLRIQPLRGEQAQVDWGYVGKVPVMGGERALWVFVMVLAYSRAMWAELVFDLDVHSLLRSLVRAGSYFGGCPRQWLFDNPKTVVLSRHGAEARFHPLLLQLCGAMRVQPRLCAVRAPWQKGRVERSMRYLWDRFFSGRTISSIQSGNEQLLTFLSQLADQRPHPDWPGLTVGQVFAQEQPHLLGLPQPLPPTDCVKPVPVDKTAFVRFDKNDYSVPSACAQKTLTLCASDTQLRLLDGTAVVAHHARCYGLRQTLQDPAHHADLVEQRPAARAPKGRERLRAVIPATDELFSRWLLDGCNVGWLTLRTLKLLDLYGEAVLAKAVTQALAQGTSDYGALAMLCEQSRRAQHRPVPLDIALGPAVPDRDVIPHSLENYDAK
jgi:transposase